jgi:hypothetical protein
MYVCASVLSRWRLPLARCSRSTTPCAHRAYSGAHCMSPLRFALSATAPLAFAPTTFLASGAAPFALSRPRCCLPAMVHPVRTLTFAISCFAMWRPRSRYRATPRTPNCAASQCVGHCPCAIARGALMLPTPRMSVGWEHNVLPRCALGFHFHDIEPSTFFCATLRSGAAQRSCRRENGFVGPTHENRGLVRGVNTRTYP